MCLLSDDRCGAGNKPVARASPGRVPSRSCSHASSHPSFNPTSKGWGRPSSPPALSEHSSEANWDERRPGGERGREWGEVEVVTGCSVWLAHREAWGESVRPDADTFGGSSTGAK